MTDIIKREYLNDQYRTRFDSNAFLDLYSELDDGEAFFLNKLYDYFTTDKVKGNRVLDLGCGPVIHRLAPASLKATNLVYSDFSDRNREFVQNWLELKESHHKFQHFFRFMSETEKKLILETGAESIEERIKSKTARIIHCDVRSPEPLGSDEKPFDVIQSCGVFESACLTYDEYATCVKNVLNILKPNGFFILMCYVNGASYKVANFTYPCLAITPDMMNKGLIEAGFRIIDSEAVYPQIRPRPDLAPSTGVAIVLAQKVI